MAIDPSQVIQMWRENLPTGTGETSDGSLGGVRPLTAVGIPMGPADPGWRSKIPPGDPLGDAAADDEIPAVFTAPAAVQARPVNPPSVGRLVLSYGRKENTVLVALEDADGEITFRKTYDLELLKVVLPLLTKLVKIHALIDLEEEE
jgi:hypothetical protein